MHERSVVAAKVTSVSFSETLRENEDAAERALLVWTMVSLRKESLVALVQVEEGPPVLQVVLKSAASLLMEVDLGQIVGLFDRFRFNLTLKVAAALEVLRVTAVRALVKPLGNPIEAAFLT